MMTELTICDWPLPTAELGPPSPLPPLRRRPRPVIDATDLDLPPDMAHTFAYGHAESLLPYSMQSDYTRRARCQVHPAAVLENRTLKAVFLLDLGGRLWSLLHKPTQAELLAQTPSITFCNLALRNAWFPGGVEWNFGIAGHSPLTCSPIHAARLTDRQGTPILRLYAWERLRQVIVQIDIFLPDESPVLLIRPRLVNPGTRTVPMYWWSNLAVPLTPGMRVLAPAETALVLGARGRLHRIHLAASPKPDPSYPDSWRQAADIFFELKKDQQPWIAAVDERGAGVFHASQPALSGRKLWVWGDSVAGHNWQAFLAPGAPEYIEIQAGVTRTQLEHFPLSAGESRAWVEAVGPLSTDLSQGVGHHWEACWRHVAERIGESLTSTSLADIDRHLDALADSPPEAILHRGEGWGALEQRRRVSQGAGPFPTPGIIFDDQSLGADQAPWITLLEQGSFPEASPDSPPRGFVLGDAWEMMLRAFLSSQPQGPWNAWLHLGIMRRSAGDDAEAEVAWNRSLDACWTPWAARNLAVLLQEKGQVDQAAALMIAAHRAAPSQQELLIECGTLLVETGMLQEWRDLLSALKAPQRAHGRVRLLEAQAALLSGDLGCVERLFAERIVPEDLREGETSLADLWAGLQERRSASGAAASGEGTLLPAIPAVMDYVIR